MTMGSNYANYGVERLQFMAIGSNAQLLAFHFVFRGDASLSDIQELKAQLRACEFVRKIRRTLVKKLIPTRHGLQTTFKLV